jgi:hypothetical protein
LHVAIILPLSIVLFVVFGLGFGSRLSGWSTIRAVRIDRVLTQFGLKRYRTINVALTLSACGMTFLWAAGPVWDWDAEMYHLPASQFLADHAGLAVSRDNALQNLPGQAHLWYALGLMAGQEEFPALLMWLAAVATSGLAACFAARWIGMHTALWTPLIYWSGVIVSTVAATPRVEPAYGLMFLTAVSLLYPAFAGKRTLDWQTVLLAGLCLGTAAGIKYQGLYGWVIVAAWFCWATVRQEMSRRRQMTLRTAAMFLIAIAVTSPWWIKNTIAWGNPVYPVFGSSRETADQLHNAASYSAKVQFESSFLFDATIGVFSSPNRLNGPPNHFPHYLFLLLPLLFVVKRNSAVTTVVLIGVAYYALSMSLALCTRYTFPMLSLLSIGSAYVFARFERGWKMRVLLSGLLAFSSMFVILLPARLVRLPQLASYLCGITDERPLLSTITPDFYAAIDWLNANTGADAVILMCWEAREQRLRRESVIDPGMRTWPALFSEGRTTAAEVANFLETQRIDYLLVNEGKLRYDVYDAGWLEEELLEEFHRQRDQLEGRVLTPVFRQRLVTVYRVTVQPISSTTEE